MKDCFVKEFKAAVSAELVKLNEIRVKVYDGSSSMLAFKDEVIKGIGVTINGETEYTIPSGGWNNLYFVGTGEISFMNKYRGTQDSPSLTINFPTDYTCISQLKFTNLKALSLIGYSSPQVRDNLGEGVTLKYIADSLPGCVSQISLCGKYLSGDITDLLVFKDSLTALGAYFVYTQAATEFVTGTFEDLGHFYKVTNFYKSLDYYVNLSGTVEGFVANRLLEAPATAGSVTFNNLGLDNRITYNGIAVASGTTTISWDAQGNITLS